MKLLFDSHTFLWYIGNDQKLSPTALVLISDIDNDVYRSVASAWELAIKASLGKLTLRQPFATFLPQQLRQNSIRFLPIRLAHIRQVASLPFHHKDPFDCLSIAQCLQEQIPVVGIDAAFDSYGVQRLW